MPYAPEAGDLIWTYDENVLRVATPFPSFADALYLVSYLAFFAGVLLLIRDHAGGPDRAHPRPCPYRAQRDRPWLGSRRAVLGRETAARIF